MGSMRLLPALCAALLLSACAPEAAGAQTAGGLNIVVIGNDADSTVRRNTPVFDRVLGAIQDKMNEAGFKVIDEPTATLGKLEQDRVRRDDGEIIRVCRAMRSPPLDGVVIFSIEHDREPTDIAIYLSVTVEARALDCWSGTLLSGPFRSSSPERGAPVRLSCSHKCIQGKLGEQAQDVGRDVAHLVASGMKRLLTETASGELPTRFRLEFDNFTLDEMFKVGEYLGAVGKHDLIDGSVTRQSIWYEPTSGGSTELRRDLYRMLECEGIEANITLFGNTFKVEKMGSAVDGDDSFCN